MQLRHAVAQELSRGFIGDRAFGGDEPWLELNVGLDRVFMSGELQKRSGGFATWNLSFELTLPPQRTASHHGVD